MDKARAVSTALLFRHRAFCVLTAPCYGHECPLQIHRTFAIAPHVAFIPHFALRMRPTLCRMTAEVDFEPLQRTFVANRPPLPFAPIPHSNRPKIKRMPSRASSFFFA